MSNSVHYLSVPAKYNYIYSYLRKKLVFLFYQFCVKHITSLKRIILFKAGLTEISALCWPVPSGERNKNS